MAGTEWGVLGVQSTLAGMLLVTFFRETYPYPQIGLVLGVVGTAAVVVALSSGTGT